ncbi:CLUMA_CG006993, isoform A [Clunio marinus]|uniref:CLUMA_CG006993, isoform A n=1 Tax=Clunio marinus TaxID=568069 RepID=A0A1J1I502_9DIPT|nr:CLUMA_CG006993, isoform A [Clunio marinus]
MPEVHTQQMLNDNMITEEEKAQKIEELRKTIEECPSLNIRTDDIYLKRFLICCNWNVADALTRITKLFKLKFENPKWFSNKKLTDYRDILKHNAKIMLHGRDKKGRRVYLSRMLGAGNLNLMDLAQLDDLWMEAMLNEVETIENGIVVLLDMNGYSWKMMKWLAPGNVKVASTKADLLPVKHMEVHVVNSSSLMNAAVSLVFPILSQSIKDQVYFHYQNFPSLHEHLGREVLPAEYGGLNENLKFDELANYLFKHEDHLNKSIIYGYTSEPTKAIKEKKKTHSKGKENRLKKEEMKSNKSSKSNSPSKSPRHIISRSFLIDPHAEFEAELNRNLDMTWREKAEKELNENNEAITKMKQMRKLIAESDISQKGREDEAFLLRFLRAKKFDVDKAFKMIQKYYWMKEHSPELFYVSPPSDLKSMLEMQIQCMLPQKDNHGRQVYVFRVEKCDPYKVPVEHVFRSNVLALEDAIRDPETQIGGLVVLLDMAGLGFAHARYLSPHLAKRTVEVVQEAFPMRFKAFHILHEPFYMDAILSVLKPFLKDKIRRRIHCHGNDLNSLYKHIPRDCLPSEYGGTQPPFDNSIWRQRILNNEEYFIRLESYNDEGMINNNSFDIYHHKKSSINDEIGDEEIFYEAEDDADDNKSLDVEIDGNSINYIDTETEDSEEYESDRVLSPKRKAPPVETLEEMFLKHEFSTFTLEEKEFDAVKT